jgi:hypothetical protein
MKNCVVPWMKLSGQSISNQETLPHLKQVLVHHWRASEWVLCGAAEEQRPARRHEGSRGRRHHFREDLTQGHVWLCWLADWP